MEYENLDALGLYDSYSRPSYVTGGCGGGGGSDYTARFRKKMVNFKEKFVVSIENI